MSITMSMILYASSFLLADPSFNCYDDKGNLFPCKEEQFCAKYYNSSQVKDFDLNSSPLINWHYESWTKQYVLICENSGYRDNYKTVTQLIASIVPLIANMLSDSFGRIKMFNIFTTCC